MVNWATYIALFSTAGIMRVSGAWAHERAQSEILLTPTAPLVFAVA